MPVVFEFEALTADFHRKLVTQLRNHGADSEYLEMWVPDEDPIRSITNMVESALAAGCQDLVICFSRGTMDEGQRQDLLTAAGELGSPRIEATADGFALRVQTSLST
jgi:hypothetical protein